MVRLVFLQLLLSLTALSLQAAPVATLSPLEGEVTVLRQGVLIPSERVAEGFPLEAFDTVTTGTTGRADVRFAGTVGVTGSVRLDPTTSLYLDLAAQKREQVVGVELVAGSVSVRLSSVVGASSLEVRTDLGVFSGTGPQFRVVGTPAGDILLSVTSGRVVCQLPVRTLFVEPGAVVQLLALDRSVQTIPVNVTTLEAFEGAWVRQRAQALNDQAAIAFRSLASQYQLQVGQFQRAWERVQRESLDEAALRPATANLRRAAFPLERSLDRIKALKTLLELGTLSPTIELTRGYASKDFFRQFSNDEGTWRGRLGEARGFYKALAERSGGAFPKASEGEGITHASDFFH